MGIEKEVAVLERRDYFFRKTQKIGELKHVKQVILEVGEAFIYSTITTGSPDQSVDEINGRFEFNSEQHWTTPITRVTNEYNILTDSRTDAYGIEFTRVNLEGKKTTDASSDNQTFIIDTVDDHYLGLRAAVRADRYSEASGSESIETVYNLTLSPKQNMLRHDYWLASALWGMEGFYINFQSALKNAELQVVTGRGVRIIEKEDIYISSLGAKTYLPIIATIHAIYDRNLWELINSTPYGYLEFIWEDLAYRGYIITASVNPATREDKEFKLLLTSDNNLLNLIR